MSAPIGDAVFLDSYFINTRVYGVVVPPGQPPEFLATYEIQGDQGTLLIAVAIGPEGPAGADMFALTLINDTTDDPANLPQTLTNTPADIGKYWVIDDIDANNDIIGASLYVWYGTTFKRLTLGSPGPQGPVPIITPTIEVLDPKENASIATGGTPWEPTLQFNLPLPAGPQGPAAALALCPDVNMTGIQAGDVLGYTGSTTPGLLSPPSGVTITPFSTGGTLTAATYYYVITASNANGETTPSNEVSATVTGTTSRITLTWSPAGENNFAPTSYSIYRGTTTGGEHKLLTQVSGSTLTYTDTGANIQTVTLAGSPTGGTFTLSFGGQTTSALAYNASAATVQAALQALSSIGAGNATVTTAVSGSYAVTLTGTLASSAQLITATSSLVPASSSTLTYTGTADIQVVTLGSPTGGTFTLSFGGQTTSALAYNASAATVQTAFLSLSSVGSGNATVTGSAGGPYTVTFTGSLANITQSPITATSSLTPTSVIGISHATAPSPPSTSTATVNLPVWVPVSISQLSPSPYSMPESSFTAFSGISQAASIGSFAIPPQPFPWIPIVWGHIGAFGVELSPNPLQIGCEVLLGNPTSGDLVARGFGNSLGEVNIMPHYSSPSQQAVAVSPNNGTAVVPAYHPDPAQGTLYVNLYNDGEIGLYKFSPTDAQLFIMVVPV